MSKAPRVVAELGRPETAEETAQRKAASSHAYRSSKTFRNLMAAMLATLGIVVIMVLAVPRGEIPQGEDIDVAAVAADIEAGYQRPVLVPDTPAGWLVNDAAVAAESSPAWTIVYATDDGAFLRVAQGFDVDDAWARSVLHGAAPSGERTIDGIVWDEYEIADPAGAGNVSYALGTQAGTDHVLVYGTAGAELAAQIAAELGDQIDTMRETT